LPNTLERPQPKGISWPPQATGPGVARHIPINRQIPELVGVYSAASAPDCSKESSSKVAACVTSPVTAAPIAAAPVAAAPTPATAAPVTAAPVTTAPAPVTAPAHLFGLQIFHLAAASDRHPRSMAAAARPVRADEAQAVLPVHSRRMRRRLRQIQRRVSESGGVP